MSSNLQKHNPRGGRKWRKNTHIYINVSTGSRLSSIAGTMA
jgi:hypothetical protein